MRSGPWFLALAIPAALAGGVLLLVVEPGPGFGVAGVRLGLLMILGCAAMGAVVGVPAVGQLRVEFLGLLAGAAAALLLGLASGLPTDVATRGAAIVLVAWLLPWCWAAPLRALELGGAARVVCLLGAAALLGTPYLVAPGWDALPAWALEWNPLCRLHLALLEEDWFHGPTLYPRIGEHYYRAPGWAAGAGVPLLSGAAAAFVGLALGRARGLARREAA